MAARRMRERSCDGSMSQHAVRTCKGAGVFSLVLCCVLCLSVVMRPSSLGGAALCVALCLSVCLSVRPVIVTERHVAPPSELQ